MISRLYYSDFEGGLTGKVTPLRINSGDCANYVESAIVFSLSHFCLP